MLPGCDKNMPGTVIAMARLNRPSIMVYGGTIKPGFSALDGAKLDVISAFQSFGACAQDLSPRYVFKGCCLSSKLNSQQICVALRGPLSGHGTAMSANWTVCLQAPIQRASSRRSSGRTSCGTRARVPARAAACTPPTR